jgi:heterodisulfide reductase subunit A
VREDLCVGCGACIEACVGGEVPATDEFNLGLASRKPVYLPYPQATPNVVLVDPETCAEFKPGRCRKTCVEACGDAAIDFGQAFETREIGVGAIVLATGFKSFDPARSPKYGYGKLPNVLTSLEAERLVNTAGPTRGEVLLKDGRAPRAIGIIHCVGSRNENTNRWCSRVCCMASLKLAHLMRERTGAEVYNFYIDMRTPGKGYEEFYDRLLEEGTHFIRGRVAEVTDCSLTPEEEGRLVIRAEDTMGGFARRVPVDMVVLAVGMEPRPDAREVRRIFGITSSDEGFFMERHARLAPVNTFVDGIMAAGCCVGPRDIADTVAQAGAAAAEALVVLDKGFVEMDPDTAYIEEEACSGCKSCITLCPYRAISFDETKKKAAINEVLCKSCGACVASCPSGSIRQHMFEDDEIFGEIEGVLDHV